MADMRDFITAFADGVYVFQASMEDLAAAQMVVGNSSNRPTAVAISGDVTISNSGAVTIGALKVLSSMINNVQPSKLDRAFYCNFFDDFLGAALNVTDGQWKTNTVETGGTPTVTLGTDVADGDVACLLDNTNEVQRAELYWGDQLVIDTAKNPIVTFQVKFSTIAANEFAVVGLCNNRNDTYDTIGNSVWFRLDADMDLLVEGDDGTTDTDDVDTLTDAVNGTYLTLKIDLSDLTAVVFSIDGTAFGTTVDLTALTGNLQPFIAVGKASGTGTPSVTLDYIEVEWDR